MSEHVIVCQDVCVAYDREDVLHNVSIGIQGGSFLPFVGPNGAGKTTLLRAIAGLVPIRSGAIITPFHRTPPGYMPQQKALDPLFPVSVRQIMEMGLYGQLGPWRRPNKEQRTRVAEALERFLLTEHVHKTFRELSGGMRQKVLLGRAFVGNPDLYIMDEPTSELDEDSENEVLAHLSALCREQGKTVLLAHHGLDKIAGLAAEVCVLNRGNARMVKLEDARHE